MTIPREGSQQVGMYVGDNPSQGSHTQMQDSGSSTILYRTGCLSQALLALALDADRASSAVFIQLSFFNHRLNTASLIHQEQKPLGVIKISIHSLPVPGHKSIQAWGGGGQHLSSWLLIPLTLTLINNTTNHKRWLSFKLTPETFQSILP